MRLPQHKSRNRHRANAADRTVQTPTMARRPSSDGPSPTQLMPAVRESGDFLTRELPKVSPSAVLPPYPHTPYMPMSGRPETHLDVTRLLPVVPRQRTAADSATPQVLPLVKAELPPSAQHVDPARWHDRTHVEDDDLEPQTRGRHVLDELNAAPDIALDLAAVPQRVINGLGGPEPAVKDPSRRLAVRMFRHARDMQRAREARAEDALREADACSRRIREFGERWEQHLRDVEITRHGQRAVVAAEELTAAYEGNRRRIAEENARRAANGKEPLDVTATTFTRGMQAKLSDLLVKEALAGSAVTR